ncbi:MAG: hypothetical protein AAGH90_03150 [Pseudomonadota bacterium]
MSSITTFHGPITVEAIASLWRSAEELLGMAYDNYEADEQLLPIRDHILEEERLILERLAVTPSTTLQDILLKFEIWANSDEVCGLDDSTQAALCCKVALSAYDDLKTLVYNAKPEIKQARCSENLALES